MLDQAARYERPVSRSVEYAVTPSAGGFTVSEDGAVLTTQPYPIDVLVVLEARMYARAFARLGSAAAVLGAACVGVEGGRLLLVGDVDVFHSGLLLALLRDGAAVEGDWCVVVEDGLVTTVAQALRIHEDALRTLPDVAALVEGRPFVQDALGRVLWSFDPTSVGLAWRLPTAPVEGIVVVESNLGGRSRLEPRPRFETAQEVVPALDTSTVSAARIATVCALVDSCSCWRLRLGGLEEGARLLLSALSSA